ncbi:MAG: SWIM zinc finger family protein [Bacilli bacterium]|nr:SWIM zinc finger family protein [Bacilli bacterium]MDD4388495.1 SWIM zinc finger family protein [Bacilli bacterium]
MFYKYVSIAEQKTYAANSIKRLEKSLKRSLEPIVLPTSKLAASWWGIMWNKNLERYATYSNRIGRGKSYVRNGLVIDLQIISGQVNAYVQGTKKTPYKVTITIDKIDEKMVESIKKQCQGKLDTLDQLLEGKFSKELAAIFMLQGAGLFPEPEEIDLRCSCPDWTDCCKHVSAVLYGIGSKLDINPLLFFTLRGIDIDDFLRDVIQNKTAAVLEKGKACQSNRIIKNADIDYLFDISLD